MEVLHPCSSYDTDWIKDAQVAHKKWLETKSPTNSVMLYEDIGQYLLELLCRQEDFPAWHIRKGGIALWQQIHALRAEVPNFDPQLFHMTGNANPVSDRACNEHVTHCNHQPRRTMWQSHIA